jgi:hypothetical protein
VGEPENIFSPGPELALSNQGKVYDNTEVSSLISRKRMFTDSTSLAVGLPTRTGRTTEAAGQGRELNIAVYCIWLVRFGFCHLEFAFKQENT